ncbi:hypothetical protein [Streptomyces europaeiscabiei]|uniref:hypothetical protein n=1 Tax=Streptomyces europaeiscabiei TaxID=146819 RepID=UPI0029A3F21A|nr:hypothetical protein [Streptomyces europaeiscabiei]MDX3781394.1 hypothetical protein [Streptomyces europaeiscabiei]
MTSSVVAHWEAACARARQLRGLDGRERDVLALIYALVAVEDGTAIDDIAYWAVRYRLSDPRRLHEALSALLPGPLDHAASTVEGGRKELTRIRIDELVDEHGQYTGPADLEKLFKSEIEAVVRDRGPFSGPAPMEGRIWRRWAALQAPHGIRYEDTLTSEELDAYDAMGRDGGYVASGRTLFEDSAQRLVQILDRMLLPASGAPDLYGEVLVTGGMHQGRSGRLNSVTWSVDDERRVCCEPPASFTISFDDRQGTADIASADVTPLPEWDRHFAVVHAGQPMPMSWAATVLLAGPDPAAWQREVIAALEAGWNGAVHGRLVVLVPHRRDGRPAVEEHNKWLSDACTWADEIISTCAPAAGFWFGSQSGPAFDLEGACDRLILQVATPDEATRRWAGQRAVPVVQTPADAAAAVLRRLGRGRRRQGGQRGVQLPVARNLGHFYWTDALRQAGRVLDAATVDWAPRHPGHPEEAQWWALTARIRHPDDRITDELVVGRSKVFSLIAFRRGQVWTDSEVVLLHHPLSLGGSLPITAPTRFPLLLPTLDMGNPFPDRGDDRDKGVKLLACNLGLAVDEHRLRNLDNRPESGLLAAERAVCWLELTEEECESLKARHQTSGDDATAGAVAVYRISDLLSSGPTRDALCDWATLGIIIQAVLSARPPTGDDFTEAPW